MREFPHQSPATSASPPVFAYGKISELKTHSFNAAMTQSSKAEFGIAKKLVQRLPSVAGWDSPLGRSKLDRSDRDQEKVCDTLLGTTPDAMSAD